MREMLQDRLVWRTHLLLKWKVLMQRVALSFFRARRVVLRAVKQRRRKWRELARRWQRRMIRGNYDRIILYRLHQETVKILQRRHYEDIAVDVVLKAAKKCLRQRLGTQRWYKSIGFSTETSCARTAQSEDTHQESTTSTNAKTRCGAGWWLLVVVLLGRKK